MLVILGRGSEADGGLLVLAVIDLTLVSNILLVIATVAPDGNFCNSALGFTSLCHLCWGLGGGHCCFTKGVGTISASSLPTAVYFNTLPFGTFCHFTILLVFHFQMSHLFFNNCEYLCTCAADQS